eukprot:CAMPEP_0178480818 /NCGR_PEP_ID=MMETSP0696-20121128/5893_1 /TAXON_ID=265572 /ORGANISM="Extubocellulus spinifer, Strain CCMP396" /LENGTH=213 /DNA_ID=CAMNT_0020108273 /DNA_START=64 /DNA_END=705 /DNA_ORIENTATION=-
MFSRSALITALALAVVSTTQAYVPQSSSTFAGGSVLTHQSTSPPSTPVRKGDLSMKKGKPNVPVNMRSNYRKQQQMASMREQMMNASQPGDDGLPVFNLFVRTKKANMWYPCGSFKGDEKSAALASNYRDQGMMAGISKKQLDSGVAGSLYRDVDKLKESVVRGYPQLRKAKDELEWGYKLAYEGLSDDLGKIQEIEPKEQKGVFDGIKNIFS